MSKKPLTSNSADPEAVARAGEREELAEEQALADMRAVLDTPEGRRVLRALVAFCGVFHTTFTGNSETFFKEGGRNVGLKILADVRIAAPQHYMALVE